MQRLGQGAQAHNIPDYLASSFFTAQRREKACVNNRGFTTARATHDGYCVGGCAMADLDDELGDEPLAPEEEASILFAEWQHAPVGT